MKTLLSTFLFFFLTLNANKSPVVTIIDPPGNVTIETGQRLHVEAEATDADGTIDSVAFYVNGTKFGNTERYARWEQDFVSKTEGYFKISARAWDSDRGASWSTNAIWVKVVKPVTVTQPPPVEPAPTPQPESTPTPTPEPEPAPVPVTVVTLTASDSLRIVYEQMQAFKTILDTTIQLSRKFKVDVRGTVKYVDIP